MKVTKVEKPFRTVPDGQKGKLRYTTLNKKLTHNIVRAQCEFGPVVKVYGLLDTKWWIFYDDNGALTLNFEYQKGDLVGVHA